MVVSASNVKPLAPLALTLSPSAQVATLKAKTSTSLASTAWPLVRRAPQSMTLNSPVMAVSLAALSVTPTTRTSVSSAPLDSTSTTKVVLPPVQTTTR